MGGAVPPYAAPRHTGPGHTGSAPRAAPPAAVRDPPTVQAPLRRVLRRPGLDDGRAGDLLQGAIPRRNNRTGPRRRRVLPPPPSRPAAAQHRAAGTFPRPAHLPPP